MTGTEILDLIGKYAGFAVTTFVAGGAGAYLSSYLKKKGETLATHEDIDKLVDQVRAVTSATKLIEAKISIDVWSQQQRWDVQKSALLDSLKTLADADTFLWRLVHAFSSTRKMEMEARNKHRFEADQKYAEALDAFWRTKLAIEIVCGRAIADQVQRIDHIFQRVRNRLPRGEYGEIWNEQYLELQAAKRELGQIIRQQLGFDPQLGGGELSLTSPITPQSNESSVAPNPDSPIPARATQGRP
jgi:hypothetical protein